MNGDLSLKGLMGRFKGRESKVNGFYLGIHPLGLHFGTGSKKIDKSEILPVGWRKGEDRLIELHYFCLYLAMFFSDFLLRLLVFEVLHYEPHEYFYIRH